MSFNEAKHAALKEWRSGTTIGQALSRAYKGALVAEDALLFTEILLSASSDELEVITAIIGASSDSHDLEETNKLDQHTGMRVRRVFEMYFAEHHSKEWLGAPPQFEDSLNLKENEEDDRRSRSAEVISLSRSQDKGCAA